MKVRMKIKASGTNASCTFADVEYNGDSSADRAFLGINARCGI